MTTRNLNYIYMHMMCVCVCMSLCMFVPVCHYHQIAVNPADWKLITQWLDSTIWHMQEMHTRLVNILTQKKPADTSDEQDKHKSYSHSQTLASDSHHTNLPNQHSSHITILWFQKYWKVMKRIETHGSVCALPCVAEAFPHPWNPSCHSPLPSSFLSGTTELAQASCTCYSSYSTLIKHQSDMQSTFYTCFVISPHLIQCALFLLPLGHTRSRAVNSAWALSGSWTLSLETCSFFAFRLKVGPFVFLFKKNPREYRSIMINIYHYHVKAKTMTKIRKPYISPITSRTGCNHLKITQAVEGNFK